MPSPQQTDISFFDLVSISDDSDSSAEFLIEFESRLKARNHQRYRRTYIPSYKPESSHVKNFDPIIPIDVNNIIAMDCELFPCSGNDKRCLVSRVLVTDYQGNPLLDARVEIEHDIKGYLNYISVSFNDCRVRVQELLKGKVVVGHNLKAQLYALRLRHPWQQMRDSCKFYPFMKLDRNGVFVPRSLEELSMRYLDKPVGNELSSRVSISLTLYKLFKVEWDYKIELGNRRKMEKESTGVDHSLASREHALPLPTTIVYNAPCLF